MIQESMNRSDNGATATDGDQPTSRLSVQQVRGLVDFIQDTVAGTVNAVENTHQAIARQPFALLERVCPVAAPVRLIERIERGVAGGVYQSIRGVNELVGTLATRVLDAVEEPDQSSP